MAVNISKMGSKGGDDSYNTDSLRGVSTESGIVEGIVKTNVDPTHNGIISVFIPVFGSEETDRNQWRQVRYSSPYYSRTETNSGAEDPSFDTKTVSGFFSPAPDVGTRVLCVFPSGRNASGYYIACVPDAYMMNTLPEAATNAQGKVSD